LEDLFETLAAQDTSRCIVVSDPPSGLRAFIVIDDTTLGPAAGGIRTRRYTSARGALEDAALLARAMTIKCALAGLPAGGGKAVVMEHAGLDRERAFERLGRRIEELGGLFRTAGDLGTSERDLAAVAKGTRYVATDARELADAVAQGLLTCLRACVAQRKREVAGLRVAVQGVGAVGAAVARKLAHAGCHVVVADIDLDRARRLAHEISGQVCSEGGILLTETDVVVPCATGGVIDLDIAKRLRAWAVCGAANNILGDPQAGDVLAARGILHVPDPISSSGGVIRGLCLAQPDRGDALIEGLAVTTCEVLEEARATGRTPQRVAEARAWSKVRRDQ
jgi:leucine dehydrogenase